MDKEEREDVDSNVEPQLDVGAHTTFWDGCSRLDMNELDLEKLGICCVERFVCVHVRYLTLEMLEVMREEEKFDEFHCGVSLEALMERGRLGTVWEWMLGEIDGELCV